MAAAKKIKNSKASDAIAEAAKLNRKIKTQLARLDELKVFIRKAALAVATRRDSDDLVEFESDEGVASVCFVRDTLCLVKGSDPEMLRPEIPEELWDALFQTKVVLKNNARDAVETMMPGHYRDVVSALLETKENEPRVTLPK